ncbi:expressed unknown protein [Seminavis robusta]|uniref:Uncharacterized protein n=1 Tax=Seminavis robusta TaxID=568900 RepID=A0A9N8ESQ8_9STRA|nr:expressed unknown protein [Seminavis robusta]|eukprot:Sro1667_g289790.1 n/a (323) ;mRNA; f:7352-8320
MSLQKSIILALLSLSANRSNAAIYTPDTSPQALSNMSEEVLMISVNSVSNMVGQQAGCITDVQVTATVVGVNKTTLGFETGNTVIFNSNYKNEGSSLCDGFVGPKAPPRLFDGWVGYAYLNDGSATTTSGILGLAAQGFSLQEEIYFGPGPVILPQVSTSSENQGSATKPPRTLVEAPVSESSMYNSCDENLLISVKSLVEVEGQSPGCLVYYHVTAEVAEAMKTTLGFKAGDAVKFTSFFYKQTQACQGIAGPSSYPLKLGWCGKVYLNDNGATSMDGALQLTAHGQSFEAADADQCATVTTVPPTRKLRGALKVQMSEEA